MSPADEHLPPPDLRLTQENLEDLYEQAPCGYCSCLPDGTFVKLNHTLLDWLGYSRHDLVARRCFQHLLTGGSQRHFETHGMPQLLLHSHVRELSYSLRRKDGTTLPVLLNATLVRDTNGEPLVVRATLFDITERRKYEQELVRARAHAEEQGAQLARTNAQLTARNEQLTRTNADLDSFVYTASHDLKQPIDNMAGLFEELKHTVTFTDPEAAGMVGMFAEAIQQIINTIKGLTEVVQVQRQPDQVPEEATALQEVANDIVRSLRPQARALAAEFTLDFAAAPTLRMARPALHSLLYNLLSNTLRYADPTQPPRIWVGTALAAGGVVLTVQDNGRGIDLARHRVNLFQLFRRFHPEVAAGSGVGLYLVHRLVEQAGGQIEVESEVGQGTTFRLFLPR